MGKTIAAYDKRRDYGTTTMM